HRAARLLRLPGRPGAPHPCVRRAPRGRHHRPPLRPDPPELTDPLRLSEPPRLSEPRRGAPMAGRPLPGPVRRPLPGPARRGRAALVGGVLAGVLALVLAACTPGSQNARAPAPGGARAVRTDIAALGPVTLTIWDQE